MPLNKIIAFIAVTDANRARAFYRDRLGLRLVREDRFSLVFDVAGTMLRASIVPEMTAANYTVLGWETPDATEAVRELKSAGVQFERYPGMEQNELGVWTAPGGARVAWFKDPDGNTLSLSQFDTPGSGTPPS